MACDQLLGVVFLWHGNFGQFEIKKVSRILDLTVAIAIAFALRHHGIINGEGVPLSPFTFHNFFARSF